MGSMSDNPSPKGTEATGTGTLMMTRENYEALKGHAIELGCDTGLSLTYGGGPSVFANPGLIPDDSNEALTKLGSRLREEGWFDGLW